MPDSADGSPPEGSGEDRLIQRWFRPIARHPAALALLDDAAVLKPPPGRDLVLTQDAIVAGVHFFPDDPPETIAQKALRVNLSDLAAKGATPLGFLMTLAFPAGLDEAFIGPFSVALADDAQDYACPLIGGDTTRASGGLTVSITALGTVPPGRMVQRAGAKPGDIVCVTGTIGDAAIGLKLRRDPALADRLGLAAEDAAMLIRRYRVPEPRLAAAMAVIDHASAAMDVSDGLAGDLAKLCRVSGVSAVIEASAVPLSGAAARAMAADPGLLLTALTGGDDYEVLAIVPQARLADFEAECQAAGVPVARLGRIMPKSEPFRVIAADGTALSLGTGSYSHF